MDLDETIKNNCYGQLKKFKNAEIFMTLNKSDVMTINNDNYVHNVKSRKSGMSFRYYLEEELCGHIFTFHGYSTNNLSNIDLNKGLHNIIPYAKIATKSNNAYKKKSNFSNDCVQIDSLVNTWLKAYISEYLFPKNTIKYLQFKSAITQFLLLNSSGVYGSGEISSLEIDIVLEVEKRDFFLRHISTNNSLKKMCDNLYLNNRWIISAGTISRQYCHSIKTLVLSQTAVGEIMSVLFHVLNYQTYYLGKTSKMQMFDLENISNLSVSKHIVLEENSPNNELISGDIDGDGFCKHPTILIKEGKICNPLTSINYCGKFDNTGSAFRVDYEMLPQVKMTSAFIFPGERKKEDILRSYPRIGMLRSFQGIYESFDPETLTFSSHLELDIYEAGLRVGIKKTEVLFSVEELLQNTIEISADLEYVNDGRLRTPDFVCEYTIQ